MIIYLISGLNFNVSISGLIFDHMFNRKCFKKDLQNRSLGRPFRPKCAFTIFRRIGVGVSRSHSSASNLSSAPKPLTGTVRACFATWIYTRNQGPPKAGPRSVWIMITWQSLSRLNSAYNELMPEAVIGSCRKKRMGLKTNAKESIRISLVLAMAAFGRPPKTIAQYFVIQWPPAFHKCLQ